MRANRRPVKRKSPPPVPVRKLNEDLMWSLWRAYSLVAAIELDVFTRINAGKATAREIAADAGANEAAMRRLLDALVALGYLRRAKDRYALKPLAKTFLVRDSDLYMDGAAMIARGLTLGWMQLAEVVRTGKPAVQEDSAARARQFFPVLVRSLFPANYLAARAAAASLARDRGHPITNILDVAAGSGAWSIAFAERFPRARVTVLDFPEVTPIAREYAAAHGVVERYEFLEGNLRAIDFGRDCRDLVILGHIVHSEGPEWGRRLIEKSAAALRKGGTLMIAEMVPNDARTGPVPEMLFSLNMLIHTGEGDVFTMSDYRKWLRAAGLDNVRTLRTAAAPSPLIFATR